MDPVGLIGAQNAARPDKDFAVLPDPVQEPAEAVCDIQDPVQDQVQDQAGPVQKVSTYPVAGARLRVADVARGQCGHLRAWCLRRSLLWGAGTGHNGAGGWELGLAA